MKILVTGSNGFIGSRVVYFLESKGVAIQKFSGDLTNKDSFDKGEFDVLIHLASLISHRENYKESDFKSINTEGTRNICDFYKDSKIVYISTKDVERENLDIYSQSKLEAEKIVLENKNNLVVRLPSVFGPNQKQRSKLIPKLFRYFTSGEDVEITNNDIREYIFVDEVANQIINLIDKTGIVNINGAMISNFRLRDLVESIFTKKIVSDTDPDEQKMLAWLKIVATNS